MSSGYLKYLDKDYKQGKNDLVCEFYVEPNGKMNMAAGAVAAESSTGTWTKLSTMD